MFWQTFFVPFLPFEDLLCQHQQSKANINISYVIRHSFIMFLLYAVLEKSSHTVTSGNISSSACSTDKKVPFGLSMNFKKHFLNCQQKQAKQNKNIADCIIGKMQLSNDEDVFFLDSFIFGQYIERLDIHSTFVIATESQRILLKIDQIETNVN